MIDIFEGEKVYGASSTLIEERPFNSVELSRLNVSVPAEVIQGKFGLSCKIYIKDSTVAFYCKSLDTRSSAVEGNLFDIKKCHVTRWRKPDTGEINIRILVLDDAIV